MIRKLAGEVKASFFPEEEREGKEGERITDLGLHEAGWQLFADLPIVREKGKKLGQTVPEEQRVGSEEGKGELKISYELMNGE